MFQLRLINLNHLCILIAFLCFQLASLNSFNFIKISVLNVPFSVNFQPFASTMMALNRLHVTYSVFVMCLRVMSWMPVVLDFASVLVVLFCFLFIEFFFQV